MGVKILKSCNSSWGSRSGFLAIHLAINYIRWHTHFSQTPWNRKPHEFVNKRAKYKKKNVAQETYLIFNTQKKSFLLFFIIMSCVWNLTIWWKIFFLWPTELLTVYATQRLRPKIIPPTGGILLENIWLWLWLSDSNINVWWGCFSLRNVWLFH